MPNERIKRKYYVFSGYKKRNSVRLMYLECKLEQDLCLTHFPVKMPQNRKKNPFRDKQTTTNESLMFFDVKALTEGYQLNFRTLSTNNQGRVYVFIV